MESFHIITVKTKILFKDRGSHEFNFGKNKCTAS